MNRDHSKLICDIGELTALFTDTSNLDGFLQKIVDMISAHMNADVCSVYLFYDDTQELVLKATKGLNASSIGKVRMKLGEGLTGTALRELRAVCEGDAGQHPDFRFFSGIGEEKYCSFLAVPILRGQSRVGVMTLQNERKNYFTPEDVNVFRAITSQLATTIEMAKLLMTIEKPDPSVRAPEKMPDLKFIKGRTGAEGFAQGEALVISVAAWDDAPITDDAHRTLDDLKRAVAETERQLKQLQAEIEEKLFDVASLIFSAQILMLKDAAMMGAMESLVKQGHPPAEAVRLVVSDYARKFRSMSNAYIREKEYDVVDVGKRLLENLTGRCDRRTVVARKVVIARELLPSEALKLSSQDAAGIVLLSGGVTSHVAVLARSLNIPLVIAEEPRLLDIPEGTRLLLDGGMGNIYINPDDDVIRKFREKEELRATASSVAAAMQPKTLTLDKVRLTLMANINLLGDLSVAKEFKAEGVGLYRTEFPFMVRSDFPTEEEQYVIYRKLVESMKGREITFRTLDIGGDKMLSYYDYSKESNPFLGLRSIRFSLKHQDIFVQQLRAIVRAAYDAPVRIMFPMVSSVDELLSAKKLLQQCLDELKAGKVPHQARPVVGTMIELPAALEVIDALAREAEFFSIGTNDLIQYVLAVDRTNEKVADLYIPHHPSVLRALRRIAVAAASAGRDVSVCGDMAHDPRYIPFLVGIGIRKFSLDARYLPKVQETAAALDTREAARFADKVLAMDRVDAIARLFTSGQVGK